MTCTLKAAWLAAALLLPGAARAGEPLSLPERAQALADAAQPLSAVQVLVDGLRDALPGLPQAGPRAAAEAEIAALQLADLCDTLQAWPEVIEALEELRAQSGPAVPHLDFLLTSLHAVALRNVGRCAEARALADGLGFLNDVLVIGPFENERGGGLDVAQPPEKAIDLAAAVPGKEREVRWRRNPCPEHPLKRLLLHEIMRPNSQALAYVATALQADAPRPVVLRVGSSGSFKVFLNGALVARRNVERPHAADQDLLVLPLQPGWNQLLVKTGIEEGDWTLELRLTDLAGRPLADLPVSSAQVATPDAALTAATAAALADASLSRPAPEARQTFEGAQDAAAARLLAEYHLLVHPDDRAAHSARAAAERAVALAPDDVGGLYLLARSQEVGAGDRTEVQVNPRLAALKGVLERAPDHAGALLDLADFSLRDNPLPARADDLTRRALDAAPESWRAAFTRAEWLRERRRGAEADRMLAQLAACPEARTRPDGAGLRGQLALERGDAPGALAELQAGFERRVLDGPLTDALVNTLADSGRTEDVLAVTRRVLEGSPFSLRRRLESAQRLEAAGELDAAAALLGEALAICPEADEVLRQRARLSERAGDHAAAEADLRQVLALQPSDDKAQRHLQILQTDVEKERFEQPYRKDALALLGTPMPEGSGEPAECLERTTVWRVHPDGTSSCYEHVVLRVLSEGGVKQLDGFPVPGLGGAVQVYHVRVLHADGRIERAPPARGGWRFYDLPPLRIGDIVDVEYRVDQDDPGVFGRYFGVRHEFQPDVLDGMLPVRRAELVVLAPPELPVTFHERQPERLQRSDATDARGLRELRWVVRDLPRPPLESAMPGRAEFSPLVDVTTYADWNAFARWWWAFIEKEFVSTPAMQAKVAELTAGLDTEREKVGAIARFVGQQIRYNSWPFGTHGYEPFSAATIFERRFGDCKDKSILMRQMLEEIGVDAVPVLINAEWAREEEPLDAAMVGLFNHCIAYVTPTAERPGYYLDATADHNPLDYLRADDQGARVLHVTPQGGEIHRIPYAPPEENSLRRRWEVSLDAAGGGEVLLQDASNGNYGVRLRYRYGGEQGDLRQKLAEDLSDTFGAVQVRDAATSDLEDIAQPATLEARFGAGNLWTAEGAARTLRLGFDDLDLEQLATEPPGERTFDVVLDRPFAQDTTVLWRLPAGARVTALPPDVEISAPGLLSYRQSAREVPEGVEVTRHFELQTRRIPVADYGGFREALQQVRQAEGRSVRIAPPPSGEGR